MEEEIKNCFDEVKQDLESQGIQEPTDEDNESSPFVPKPLSSTIMGGMAKRERSKSENAITNEPSSSCIKDIDSNSDYSGDTRNCVTRWVASLRRKWNGLTRRQLAMLTFFGIVDLLAATIISIQAPFYPEVVRDLK